MRAVDLIVQKRAGGHHTDEQVHRLIEAYLGNEVADSQMAAWLMAVCWQGLDAGETRALTLALAGSGRRLSYPGLDRRVVDKHSTGGVGDKTTLVLAPMLAAAGVAVAKMSGRGLGHSGGTIDKLESIPGVVTTATPEAFVTAVRERGLVVAAQSPELAPGDGRLYALRDVTGTVESIPLIASSVMSKKIAVGADAIVLDVKTGAGAFMKDLRSARTLARTMVSLGTNVGVPTSAVISDMDEPLGYAIGNALEVREAVDSLRGQGPPDLLELCFVLGAEVLTAAGAASTRRAARQRLAATIESGSAFQRLRALVAGMGGDVRCIDNPDLLPRAPHAITIPSLRTGYVAEVDALTCAHLAIRLGAGRTDKDGAIDPAVGLVLHAKTGAYLARGAPLATVHARQRFAVDSLAEHPSPGLLPIAQHVQSAFRWSNDKVPAPRLILGFVRPSSSQRS